MTERLTSSQLRALEDAASTFATFSRIQEESEFAKNLLLVLIEQLVPPHSPIHIKTSTLHALQRIFCNDLPSKVFTYKAWPPADGEISILDRPVTISDRPVKK